jgi:hypothetical protein
MVVKLIHDENLGFEIHNFENIFLCMIFCCQIEICFNQDNSCLYNQNLAPFEILRRNGLLVFFKDNFLGLFLLFLAPNLLMDIHNIYVLASESRISHESS